MARPRGFLRAAVGTGARNEHDDVIRVKQLLQEFGLYEPDGEIDDTLDKGTDHGIRTVQEQTGLAVDGLMNPGGETERNFVALTTGNGLEFPLNPAELKIRKDVGAGGANDPADVATIKRAFGALGAYRYDRTRPPPPYIDAKLVDAVRGFQRDKGLFPNGLVDPGGETQKALQNALHTVSPAAGKKDNSLEDRRASGQPDSKLRPFRPTGISLFPAAPLTKERQKEFTGATGLAFSRRGTALELTDRNSGDVVALMSEDAARHLVDNWEDLAARFRLMRLLGRNDLSPEQKIEEADRLLPPVDRATFPIDSMPAGFARKAARRRYREEHQLVENARAAFRDAVRGLAGGKSREEVLPQLQKHLFPEIRDQQGGLSELALDVMPGIGNIRSIGHAWNDILEIGETLSDGEISDAAAPAAMLLLDTLGILPGGNVAKEGARHFLKITPYGEAMLGQAKFSQLKRQYTNLTDPAGPSRLFPSTFDSLPAETKKALIPNANAVVGAVGERRAMEIARMIDPHAEKAQRLTLRNEAPGKYRTHDLKTRDLKTVVFDDLMSAYAKLASKGARARSPGKHFEIKSGAAEKTPHQQNVDTLLTENPEKAKALGVHGVGEARVLFKQLPLDEVLKDMKTRLDTMLRKGTVSASVADSLVSALEKEIANGTKNISAIHYADVMFRLGAAGIRGLEDPSEHGK